MTMNKMKLLVSNKKNRAKIGPETVHPSTVELSQPWNFYTSLAKTTQN